MISSESLAYGMTVYPRRIARKADYKEAEMAREYSATSDSLSTPHCGRARGTSYVMQLLAPSVLTCMLCSFAGIVR